MDNNNWWQVENINDIDSPALLFYKDRISQNIDHAISMVTALDKLRPHVKTHKSASTTRMMIERGIHKFKCATIAEASMLASCGAKDILLAYQPVGPKMERLFELVEKYPHNTFSCLVDNEVAAIKIAELFSEKNRCLSVYIDLDLGQHRTGIPVGADAIALYESCKSLNGIEPVGLHAYDGHIRAKLFSERKEQCDNAFEKVELLAQAIEKKELGKPIIIAGGSPTFSIHCRRPGIECSPGTFVLWDDGYAQLCAEQPFVPAALVLARVISLLENDMICVDLGHKSVAAENPLGTRVRFLNVPELIAVTQSEEHLVLQHNGTRSFHIGEVLYGLPYHICPTVALYNEADIIINGKRSDQWKIDARK